MPREDAVPMGPTGSMSQQPTVKEQKYREALELIRDQGFGKYDTNLKMTMGATGKEYKPGKEIAEAVLKEMGDA